MVKLLRRLCLIPVASMFLVFAIAGIGLRLMPWYVNSCDDDRVKDVCNILADGNRTVAIKNVGEQEVHSLMEQVNDDPRLFWLDINYSAFNVIGIYTVDVKEKYDNIEYRKNEIELVVNDVVNSVIEDGMSERDKAMAIYKWVCENIEYGFGDNHSDQDIYGALVLKKAVCAGYAKSFVYLLREIGIEASVVSGYAVDSSGNREPHSWALVYLDNQPYYCDVTWDDRGDVATYDWFCVKADEFSATHQPGYGYDWAVS